MSESRRAVRNAGWLVGQRGLHLVVAALFALLVPRLMGPETFGRYALLTSVSMWFGLLTGLGAVSLMTRQVPQLVAGGDVRGLPKLVTNLLALRLSTGVLSASGYFLFMALALHEGDWIAVACIAAAVFVRTIANLCFSLFLGLNRAAWWGMGELLRRALVLAGVLAGFPVAGLTGACAGFLAANLVVLAVGLVGARGYLDWSLLDLRRAYLSPYLRIGTSFAAGNVLLTMAHQSGEAVVRLATGDYAEVGYYGAAHSIYMTGAHAIWQAAIAFGPLLVSLMASSQPAAVATWLERLLKPMGILAGAAVLATMLVGEDLVPLILGRDFAPVAACLVPLALALVPQAIGSIGRLAALAADRPGLSAAAGATELGVFWTAGPLLASRYGAVGMAAAACAATSSYAVVIMWAMRAVLPYSARGALQAAGLALLFLPLALLRGSPAVDAALLALALGGYACALVWRRVVTKEELAALRRVTRAQPVARSP